MELSEDESDADDNELSGNKKSKFNNLNLMRKKVKSRDTLLKNNSSNLRQNSNADSSVKNSSNHTNMYKTNWPVVEPNNTCDPIVKENAVASLAENHQQQSNSSILGVSDRISKEKQKFFRFSVFNIERKSKFDEKNSKKRLLKQHHDDKIKPPTKSLSEEDDKYAFTSNSDSSCDNTKIKRKFKPNSITNNSNNKNNSKNITQSSSKLTTRTYDTLRTNAKSNNIYTPHISSDDEDSSCCSSGENESSSASSSSSESTSSSTDDGSSLNNQQHSNLLPSYQVDSNQTSLKTDAINTMNVFACINSREFLNTDKKSNCWASLPFVENQRLESFHSKKQQNQPSSRSFGFSSTLGNDVWGFAAVAQKPVNVFNSNIIETTKVKSVDNYKLSNDKNLNSSLSTTLRKPFLRHPNEYFVKSRRKTTLMNNNVIASSDEEATPLSPSKLFKKAVTYKKFDIFSNKCLLMGANNHGQNDDKILNTSYEMDNSNQSTIKCSQSPYKDNNQFDLGKNSNES